MNQLRQAVNLEPKHAGYHRMAIQTEMLVMFLLGFLLCFVAEGCPVMGLVLQRKWALVVLDAGVAPQRMRSRNYLVFRCRFV
jgi:hypothetical protein